METLASPLLWTAFALSVFVALAIDFMGLNNKQQQTVSFKSAAIWSLVWFSLALAFGGLLWWETSSALGSVIANEKAAILPVPKLPVPESGCFKNNSSP